MKAHLKGGRMGGFNVCERGRRAVVRGARPEVL